MSLAFADAKVVRSTDPGRTRKLRKAFSANANMQVNKLRAMLRQAVVEYNILGLSGPSNFTFMTPAARLQQFSGFLETAANASLDARWWVYPWIDRATQHGLKSAQAEMGGQEHQPIPTTFESLHQLAHDELKGIIGALVQKVMRVAHVVANRGLVPHQAFRELMKPIDGDIRNRLQLFSQYITVKGHIHGKVAYYRHHGVTHVGVNPELRIRKVNRDKAFFDKRKRSDDDDEVGWTTAGDDLVCDDCEDMSDGSPYSIDEVMDLIPLHANCRCDLIIWNDPDVFDSARFRCDGFDPDEERDEHGQWGSGGSAAIKEYVNGNSSGHAFKLNPMLRAGGYLDENQKEIVEKIDRAIAVAKPIKKAEIVYRVAPSGTYESGNYGTAGAHKDNAFISTASNYEDAVSYADEGDTIYEILLPPGTKYAETEKDDRSNYVEKILPRGSIVLKTGKAIQSDTVRLKYFGVR